MAQTFLIGLGVAILLALWVIFNDVSIGVGV